MRYLLCILDFFFSCLFLFVLGISLGLGWILQSCLGRCWRHWRTGRVPDFLLISLFSPKALDLGLFGCCRRWSCSTVCRGGVMEKCGSLGA